MVKYQKTNKRHRLTQKDHKRKRIARVAGFTSSANTNTVKLLIPYK
jgi:Ribosomal protein L35.